MTKDNIVIGVRMSYDHSDKKIYMSLEDQQNVIEGNVVNAKLTFNVPREAQYQALFNGKVEIELENYPCYLMDETSAKVNKIIGTITPVAETNQIPLFNQNSEESNVSRKDAFDSAIYESHRLAGTKYRPDPSLSKKQAKRWHNDRRAYEAKKGYVSMYPSEKGGHDATTDEKPVQQEATQETAQQPTNESKEQVKEDTNAKAIADAMGIDVKDVEVVQNDVGTKVQPEKEKPIDIGKEYAGDKGGLDIGEGNEFATFGANWEGFCIAYHHKKDNLFTIAATTKHPENGCIYYLTFPTDRGAKFVRDLMLKHGDLNEQVKDSQIYKICDILLEELKATPCVIIRQGLPYLNSIKV